MNPAATNPDAMNPAANPAATNPIVLSKKPHRVSEGYMPFKGFQTYYRIVEPVDVPVTKPALVLLHGGPGSTHNYMELLDELCEDGRQVISYDQLGCGNSYVDGHPELWVGETWLEELCNLLDYLGVKKFHLLGQSWGGMLLLMYLIEKKAVGVRSAILSSTLPASWLWGKEQHRMIRYMSAEDQAAIREAEESGDYSSEAYETANEHFMERHCAPSKREREAAARKAAEAAAAGKIVPATPECLTRPKRSGTESYVTAWGPNEYTPLGTLKDFDYIDRLGEISVPCLVVSGTDDLCTPLIAKTMADGIPGARWELFENCRHMCFAENHPRYVKMMREWLAEE